MYDEQIIRDFYGRPIGIVWNYDNGDIAVLGWPDRVIKGYYRKKTDTPTDFYGRPLSRGNTVLTLINK